MGTGAKAQPESPPPSFPGSPTHELERHVTIPTGYGDTRIVLLVKDPWWIHAYWEVSPQVERAARSQIPPQEIDGLRSILRIYDVTQTNFPEDPPHRVFDIPLSGLATNWYIHVDAPDCAFVVDIGLLTNTGRFIVLARSNRVRTPRAGPSDLIDEEWRVTDEEYWKLFGITAGVGMGSSPTGIRRLIEQKLFSPGFVSSPGLFSPVKIQKPRGFSLWVDTELIVYGATDPKATVAIQSQPINVRSDGTFSVRMALPEGTHPVSVEATSPDRQELRIVTPIVTRRTEGETRALAPDAIVKTPGHP